MGRRYERDLAQITMDGCRVCVKCAKMSAKEGIRSLIWVRVLLSISALFFIWLIIRDSLSSSSTASLQTSAVHDEKDLTLIAQEDFSSMTGAIPGKVLRTAPSVLPDLEESGINSASVLTNISHVFYNRVPKCGSRTILRVFEILAEKNHLNNYHSEIYNTKQLTPQQEVEFVRDFMAHEAPLLHDRHLYFVDFQKHGHQMPLYINLIRDPFERILSRHYYILYESKRTPQEVKEDFNLTFSECVQQNKRICMSPSNLIELVRYFCGQDPVCESKGGSNNPTILSRAKTHVQKYFSVVGVIEDAENFFLLLEKRMPSFFEGAVEAYRETISKLKVKYRNSQKIMPDDKTKNYVISKMSEAYDFYNFVKQRQYNMLQVLEKSSKVS